MLPQAGRPTPQHSLSSGISSGNGASTSVNASGGDTSSNNGNGKPYTGAAFKPAPGNALPPSSKLYPIDVAAWSSGSMQYPNTTYNALYTSSGYTDTTRPAPNYSTSASTPHPQPLDVPVHPVTNDPSAGLLNLNIKLSLERFFCVVFLFKDEA